MHKKCNAKKGDLIPNEDGTLPKKAASTFRFRRQKRAGRPELCGECDNGHALNMGEVCANCGCNAQRFPRSNHAPFSECDHELFWCIWCSIGDIPRVSSVGIAMRKEESSMQAIITLTNYKILVSQGRVPNIEVMSLDHDLGMVGDTDDTSRYIVLWMCNHDFWPDEVVVHSANPPGVYWLESMIERYHPSNAHKYTR
jgi:hypothetical protein